MDETKWSQSRKLKEEEEEFTAQRRRGAEGRRGREILNVGFLIF
jgi:hypothetical protein